MRCKACNRVLDHTTYREVLMDVENNIYEQVEEELCPKCIGAIYVSEGLEIEELDLTNQISLGDGNYMTGSAGNSDEY